MFKILNLSLLIAAGMITGTTVIAAPLDEVTMEVIEAGSISTSEVLNEIRLPARYDGTRPFSDGPGTGGYEDDIKSTRDAMRDSRDEMKEDRESFRDSRDEMKGN